MLDSRKQLKDRGDEKILPVLPAFFHKTKQTKKSKFKKLSVGKDLPKLSFFD